MRVCCIRTTIFARTCVRKRTRSNEKRFDGKADNSKSKTSDRAGDLDKKIEQLQKEIQELKDALKKSGASLPGVSGALKGIATR